jgi:hypothetical protein
VVQALDNGFAAVEDVAAVQAICDSLTEDKIEALARKWLAILPALRQIGFTATRRLLGAQKLSHDPITGADALARVTDPVITETGTRVAGLRLTDPRSLAP